MNSHEPVMNRRGLRKTKSCHMSGALIIFLLFDLCTTVGEIGGVSKLECPPPIILMQIWLISGRFYEVVLGPQFWSILKTHQLAWSLVFDNSTFTTQARLRFVTLETRHWALRHGIWRGIRWWFQLGLVWSGGDFLHAPARIIDTALKVFGCGGAAQKAGC